MSRAWLPVFAPLLMLAAGCLKETSFRFEPHERAPADRGAIASRLVAAGGDLDTRTWLQETHARLAPLLPSDDDPALLTEDLVDSGGQPVDVLAHFHRDPDGQNKILTNFFGMIHTAQASGANEAIDHPAAPWPGFEDLRIPINEKLWINARLGLARDEAGQPRAADCIVLLPGILGDLAVKRTRDMAMALRDHAGQHVCAIELRGFGQTERFQPELPYNFGVLETSDLLAVSDWLAARPHVRRTGLIGFCWSANGALLAAWEDARTDDDPDVAPRLRPHLHRSEAARLHGRPDAPWRCTGRHFEAGILAFSPTVAFEKIIEQLDERTWTGAGDPALATLQKNIIARCIRKGYPERSGSLRQLIEREFARSVLAYPEAVEESLRYLRLLPHREKPAGRKLDPIRVPVLIVHASNDILADARDVTALVATTRNPRVAALMLDGGGHVGFAPYAKRYFYNLLLAFFDRRSGPGAASEAQLAGRR